VNITLQVNPDKEENALKHGFEAVVEYDYFNGKCKTSMYITGHYHLYCSK